MKGQNSDQAKDTVEALQRSINKLNDKQKRQIMAALKIDELTGKTIRKLL